MVVIDSFDNSEFSFLIKEHIFNVLEAWYSFNRMVPNFFSTIHQTVFHT